MTRLGNRANIDLTMFFTFDLGIGLVFILLLDRVLKVRKISCSHSDFPILNTLVQKLFAVSFFRIILTKL